MPQHLPLLVTGLGDEVDGEFYSNLFTLREAIDIANAVPGPDDIFFHPDWFPTAPTTPSSAATAASPSIATVSCASISATP